MIFMKIKYNVLSQISFFVKFFTFSGKIAELKVPVV